jgi:catechol-2,3-dioxygenase
MHILELQLATNYLIEQHDFYSHVLGLPVHHYDTERLTLQIGTSRLTFVQQREPLGGCYHFAFNIPENQFAQGKAWLQQRAQLLKNSSGIDEYAFESWNAHGVYFLDPAGNIAELIARHSLPNARQAPFNAESLLNVSEIGVAAIDVLTQADAISAHSNYQIYAGPGSPVFTAVGDEHGLFIIVPEGRIWNPETGKAAAHLPISVVTGSVQSPLHWQFPK